MLKQFNGWTIDRIVSHYVDLLDYATFASLIFYIVTITGLFVLRKKEPNTPRPYKAFGYPIIPILYILLAGFICIDLLFFKTFNESIILFFIFIFGVEINCQLVAGPDIF